MQEKKIDVPFLHLLFLLSSSFLKEYSERERERQELASSKIQETAIYIYILYIIYIRLPDRY